MLHGCALGKKSGISGGLFGVYKCQIKLNFLLRSCNSYIHCAINVNKWKIRVKLVICNIVGMKQCYTHCDLVQMLREFEDIFFFLLGRVMNFILL